MVRVGSRAGDVGARFSVVWLGLRLSASAVGPGPRNYLCSVVSMPDAVVERHDHSTISPDKVRIHRIDLKTLIVGISCGLTVACLKGLKYGGKVVTGDSLDLARYRDQDLEPGPCQANQSQPPNSPNPTPRLQPPTTLYHAPKYNPIDTIPRFQVAKCTVTDSQPQHGMLRKGFCYGPTGREHIRGTLGCAPLESVPI